VKLKKFKKAIFDFSVKVEERLKMNTLEKLQKLKKDN
jgi:hypothetical protein